MIRLDHVKPPEWPGARPDRLASTIRADAPEGCRVALLGLPDDLGVRMNGGRPGAVEGPRAFRAALASYGSIFDLEHQEDIEVRVYDAGDVTPAEGDGEAALRETHARISAATRALHDQKFECVVCIGGGHDLTFASVRGLAESMGRAVGGINIDPHLDVRETAGSGMPYRALIEGEHLDPVRFVEFGAGRFANSGEHVRWLRDRGAAIIPDHKARSLDAAVHVAFERAFPAGRTDTGFVSVDLDALDSSSAPGVSAPNPNGLSVERVCAMAQRAGEHPAVRHFDIMELSPPNDVGSRTARVAALVFMRFISGLDERTGIAP